MSSPKYNKKKGTEFEVAVMKWLRSMGAVADRLRLAGKDDEDYGWGDEEFKVLEVVATN